MTNQLIGYIDCPHCNKEVSLKESKKGKAYYTCGDCGQFFARTQALDAALRAKARPSKAAEVTALGVIAPPKEEAAAPAEAKATKKTEEVKDNGKNGFWNRPL